MTYVILERLNVNTEIIPSEDIELGADMFADDIRWNQENSIEKTPDHWIWRPVAKV